MSRNTVDLPNRFDAVVALELIEHLEWPRALLESAAQMASCRGHLLLSTQSGPVRETERRVGHRRHFSQEELGDLLRGAGWHPIRIWNTGYPFHDLSKWYANLNAEASMARFSERAYGWSERLVCLGLRLAFRFNSRRRGAQLFAVAQRAD